MRKPKCFGNPSIAGSECARCGHRIECFEDFNESSEWKLLIRQPEINLYESGDDERIVRDEKMEAERISPRGLKYVLSIIQSVLERTRIRTTAVQHSKGVTWYWYVEGKKKARRFALVRRATGKLVEIALEKKSDLLAKFVKSPRKDGQRLKVNPKSRDERESLIYHLSIALLELRETTRKR